MTFEGQYLTYAEYQTLGGSAIGEKPFNLLEFEARKQIDKNTLMRLKNVNIIPQEVKVCDFNLINSIKSYIPDIEGKTAKNKNITSENTDGYSVGYVNPAQIKSIVESKNSELTDIITNDLFGVFVNGEHIIYIGV